MCPLNGGSSAGGLGTLSSQETANSWQVQRSDCNLRWIQLGDATSAGQFNLLRQWQMVSRVNGLIGGKQWPEPKGSECQAMRLHAYSTASYAYEVRRMYQ